VYGPGTQGQGDQCAPSRQFNQGIHWSPYLDLAFNYEELFVATMVARGFAIVTTGADLLQKVQDQCIAETIAKFMFRHLQPYFSVDIFTAVNQEPFKSLFDMQRIGRFKPAAPVPIVSNRFEPAGAVARRQPAGT